MEEMIRRVVEACRENRKDPEAKIGAILIRCTYGGHR